MVKKSLALASILPDGFTPLDRLRYWNEIQNAIEDNYNILWDDNAELFMDNTDTRTNVHPQDGNSWAIFAEGLISKQRAKTISKNLKKRWNKYGAPAVEVYKIFDIFLIIALLTYFRCQIQSHHLLVASN